MPRGPQEIIQYYLYDGAPAERNIINMASATEAMDISRTTPVPHNTVTFSAAVEGLVKLHADVSVKARNGFIPSLLVTQVGVDDMLSTFKPHNEEQGGTHAYAAKAAVVIKRHVSPA